MPVIPRKVYYQRRRVVTSNPSGIVNTFDTDYETFNSINISKPDVVRNTDWKTRIARRLPVSAGWSRQGLTVDIDKGVASHGWKDFVLQTEQTSQLFGQFISSDIIPILWSPDMTALDRRVQTNLLKKIYSVQTSFQGGVFLGEFKEVVHMFRHPLQAINKQMEQYLKAVVKGRRRKMSLRDVSRMVSGTWLEFAYGMQPLVSDLQSAAEAYSHSIAQIDSESVHAFEQIEGSGSPDSYIVGVDGYMNISYKILFVNSAKIKYAAGVKHTAEDTTQRVGDFGLGLRDFAPTIWELIPYSFLADYVVGIGDMIEAMSVRTSDVYYCTKTTTVNSACFPSDVRFTDNLTLPGVTNPQITASGFRPNKLKLTAWSFDRNVVDPSTLSASLRWKLGGSIRKAKKIANVSALLTQSLAASRFLTQGKSK